MTLTPGSRAVTLFSRFRSAATGYQTLILHVRVERSNYQISQCDGPVVLEILRLKVIKIVSIAAIFSPREGYKAHESIAHKDVKNCPVVKERKIHIRLFCYPPPWNVRSLSLKQT